MDKVKIDSRKNEIKMVYQNLCDLEVFQLPIVL